MPRRRWFGVVLAACACASPPATKPDAAALALHWRHEPGGAHGQLELSADGSGRLWQWPHDGTTEAPHTLTLGPATVRADVVATASTQLAAEPRWVHVSSTFAGVRVAWSRHGRTMHESSGTVAPSLAALIHTLSATHADLAEALRPLLGAPAVGSRFTFSTGDDPTPLAAILEAIGPDVPLRHLAARILIAERGYAFVPRLAAAFERSRAADGLGDYFLASALLRLGAPIGLARVLDVRGSSRPDWAAEASADLDACLPDEARSPAVELEAWLHEHATTLSFDRRSARYSLRPGAAARGQDGRVDSRSDPR